MKHVIALILLCLPLHLAAAERCNASRHDRLEPARPGSGRPLRLPAPKAWQRLLIFEQQIL